VWKECGSHVRIRSNVKFEIVAAFSSSRWLKRPS